MFERQPAVRQPARLVPKEEIGVWRRWHTARLEIEEEKPLAAEPEIDESARLAEELAALREAARAAGHAEGFGQGHAEGFAQGEAEGRRKGEAEGHAQGLQQGAALAEAQAAALRTLAEQCAGAVSELEAGVAEALARLAIDVARELVRGELAARPEHIVAVVREVLHGEHAARGPVQVFVHPDDADLLTRHLGDELAENGWRLVVDAELERGGCRLRSPYGDIDATLQTRWQRVMANLGRDTPWQPA